VQTGCNKQIGSIVFGVEGDFNFSNLNSKVNATYLPTASSSAGFTISAQTDQVSTKPDWFSTLRARFGIAIDRLLIYGTGGLAEVHIKSTTNVSFGPAVPLPVLANAVHIGSNSFTKTEGVVGAGAEYAFNNNWSAKIEYLHVGLGHFGYNSPLTAPAGVAPGYSWRTAAHFQDNLIRVGLNYRY
jgi:outer membrane immunogenic protein